MKIVVTGTRGIPNIQGGIETHCEELYPRLVSLNYEVIILRRSCYIPKNDKLKEYKGIKLVTLFTVRLKTLETLLHTFLAVIWAKINKADILHIHAIGPAIYTAFAKLLGLKVVFTHHGPDYDRAKWGPLAKSVLRKGEKVAAKKADEIIVISNVIKDILEKKYNRFDSNLIFNGFSSPVINTDREYIEKLGLEPRKYVFTLGRFVEEKGFDLLIKAFREIQPDNLRLVIAGKADHETAYSEMLRDLAVSANVVLTGFVKGKELQQLFNNACLFVLPSFHEGLPISLLEAMSYKLPVLVSDIPANKEVAIPEDRYFKTGDLESLTEKLKTILAQKYEPVNYDMSQYNWDTIAQQTAEVYEKIRSR